MVKCDSLLKINIFHSSRVQWWQAFHHSNRHLALRMLILGLCAVRQWKPILWSSRLTVLPEVIWNSRKYYFYTLRASALGGPILPACVAYHFAVELLFLLDVTSYQCSSSRAEIWQTDLFWEASYNVATKSVEFNNNEWLIQANYFFPHCYAIWCVIFELSL